MGAIAAALGFILNKIVAALSWLGDLVKAAFVAVWDLLSDAACWVFEQVLTIVAAALNVLDFSALTQWVGSWSGLPAETLEVISAIGISTAFGIIVTAIGIRIMLQLIPFTRLGS